MRFHFRNFYLGRLLLIRFNHFLSFFEAGLIPMFLIIGIWGGPRRIYSAYKFFFVTLLGSVLMLAAIIFIYWTIGTTDYTEIYKIKIAKEYQYFCGWHFLAHLQ